MSESAYDRVIAALRAHGCKVIENGHTKAGSTCPHHEDHNPSVSVTGIHGQVLVHCHAGCTTGEVLGALDLAMADLYDERSATYRYDDGRTVSRFYDDRGKKRFTQTGAGPTSTLYHLAELQQVPTGRSVFLVEGEKDVHAIEAAGGVATTAPQGADSFHKVDVGPLAGHVVTVVVDRDGAGAKWAAQVDEKLTGVAEKFRFVHAKEGKDAADHIAAGHALNAWEPCEIAIEKPQQSRFRQTILRRSQLRDLPPVEPLIEGVISLRSTVMLIGSSGAGKTFLTIAWACSIGTGTAWLGHKVHRAKVLYVVGEGANGLDDRISAWEQAWGVRVTDDDVVFSIRPESLTAESTWAEMQAEAKALGCRVIVLDTFSSLASDADETKDAATVVRRMSDLGAAIDGTVILVHHPGWGDATRARGGSQLESNADEVLILHGTKTDPLIALERKKVKEGVSGDKMWLRRRPTHGSVIIEAITASEQTEALAATAEQVAQSVFDGTFTKTQLRDALMERMSISNTTAYEHITAMSRAHHIRFVSGKGRAALYEMEPVA